MIKLVEIIVDFWQELVSAVTNILKNRIDIDIKTILIRVYNTTISIDNMMIMIMTILTIIYMFRITIKFIKMCYNFIGDVL